MDNTTALRLVVTARRKVATDVIELELADPAGRPLPNWTAGAHIELELAPGMTRHYSLCGDLSEHASWRIAILRVPDGRGGSRRVHDAFHPGTTVTVTALRNRFPLAPASGYEFLAGGIGITPLIPMLDTAQRSGATWRLTYGGRTANSMAYADDLLGRYGDRVKLVPQNRCGLIDLGELLARPSPGTLVYCCGPEPLLAAVEAACKSWPLGTLHMERFTAKPVDEVVDSAFEVELARSGGVHKIPPGASILDTLNKAGVDVLGSCLEGVCGTCETTVLDGAIDHRDSYLTPSERTAGDRMMICVSRAACPRLRLDL